VPRLKALRNRLQHALIWQRHRLVRARQRAQHPLRYLFLEVTRRCNLACAYCGSSCTGRADAAELTTPEWIEVIRAIAGDFPARQVMVAVTGGEPLLKEGVFDLFEELKRLGFPYGMVTNGQLLDQEAARRLVRAGMVSLSLSMDGPPELNDQLRGRGVAENVARAVRHLHEAGYKGKLEIISTLTRPTVATLEPMRRWIASLRVPLWRIAPVMPIGRAGERPELVPDASDVRAMLEYLLATRKDGYTPRPEFGEEGYLGRRYEGHVRPYLCQCNAGITVGGIRHDGRIGACPELSDAFDQGDVRKDRFKDVWDHGYDVMRDRRWARVGPCADCEHWKDCQGGALHLYEAPGSPFLRCFWKMLEEAGRPVQAPQARAQWYPGPEA
jgi:radical SAM protein with 4Fe4S-binding SPASM domain